MSNLFEKAKPILSRLKEKGYEAYFVGGSVRDFVMGRSINDIDIATSAMPEEVKEVFERTIDVGIEHGTVLVLYEDEKYEVTTFRTESTYSDFRRPDSVHFVRNLREDLKRRDFTMNALAMSENGQIIDHFQGLKDIDGETIRAVGDPGERFHEDALRMLRAIRFQAQLGFELHKDTLLAIEQNAAKIAYISQERITIEFEKMLLGPFALKGVRTLIQSGLVHHLQHLHTFSMQYQKLHLEQLKTIEEKWAHILLTTKEDPSLFLRSWKCSNKKIREIKSILNCFDSVRKNGWSNRLLFDFGLEICKSVERLFRIDGEEGPNIDQLYQNLCIKKIQDLEVNGKDLLEWTSLKAGPWVSQMMEEIIDLVLKGKLCNEKEQIRGWILNNLPT